MKPRPRPLLGMVLGLLLGLVVVGLLWQLAAIDPGRTVLFGTLAITTYLVTLLLTRVPAAARARYTAVVVVSALLGGVALAGIPELVRHGSISDGCTLEATVDGTTYTPSSTAALTPLDVPSDAVVTWSATSETPVAVAERVAGVMVGGFAIPVRTVSSPGAPEGTAISGDVDVAAGADWIADRTWLEPTGVYHAYGRMSGGSVTCLVEGYVAVAPAGAFATNTLVILWAALGLLAVLIGWGAIAVWRSFRRARNAPATDGSEAGAVPLTAAELAALDEPEGAPVEHVAPAPAWTPGSGQPVVAAEEISAPPTTTPPTREIPVDDVAETAGDDTARGSRGGGAAAAAPAAMSTASDDAAAETMVLDAPGDAEQVPESAPEPVPEEDLASDEEPPSEDELANDEEPPADEEQPGEDEMPGDEEAALGEDEAALDEEPEDETGEAAAEEQPDADLTDAEGEPAAEDEERIVPEDAEAEPAAEDEPDAAADESGDAPADDEGPEPASEDEGSGPKPVSSV
ncbi:hypothetical protein [Demequina mangrovi]|uniref:Uncharacterized protein n=1 Tax=Demequina mangrovi TaxID=1043493 RepID=A0A1H6V1Q7_9MICO|nr:hypothetical protein [Demequina mangrovi]SEI94185.1 hypothetical protein SAMN05421637_0483 [Demequina mangrovi]